jgi:hypothetical protein
MAWYLVKHRQNFNFLHFIYNILFSNPSLYLGVCNLSSFTKVNQSGNADLTKWVSGTHSSQYNGTSYH